MNILAAALLIVFSAIWVLGVTLYCLSKALETEDE